MKRAILLASLLVGAMSVPADMVAYQATALNTPQTGYFGEVVGVQACSTNATGTATISAVTDLSVGGNAVSFTNRLASVTLVDGVANISTNGVFVASRQRIVVSGNAFPGGSVTVWIRR